MCMYVWWPYKDPGENEERIMVVSQLWARSFCLKVM